jgi:hypothetical protein
MFLEITVNDKKCCVAVPDITYIAADDNGFAVLETCNRFTIHADNSYLAVKAALETQSLVITPTSERRGVRTFTNVRVSRAGVK